LDRSGAGDEQRRVEGTPELGGADGARRGERISAGRQSGSRRGERISASVQQPCAVASARPRAAAGQLRAAPP